MSRPLRLEFPDALYHLTSRGDRREDIFEDDSDRSTFLEVFASVIDRFNWVCYAYCLMGNHYHLLVQTPDSNLSKGMRQLNGVYTQAYNRRHDLTGHLFQGRYKSILVDQDSYLLELSRYIVLNPVKAGMVKRVEHWQWSSYPAMIGEALAPNWLQRDFLLAQFGKQPKSAIKKYQTFVRDGLRSEPIWARLRNQVYLGDDAFVEQVQKRLENKHRDLQIPKVQKRPVAKTLPEYENACRTRDEAIVLAYASGAYSYQHLSDYFGLHFTRIGKIVRSAEGRKSNI